MGGVDVKAVNEAIDAKAREIRDGSTESFVEVAREVVGKIYIKGVLDGKEPTTADLVGSVNEMSKNPDNLHSNGYDVINSQNYPKYSHIADTVIAVSEIDIAVQINKMKDEWVELKANGEGINRALANIEASLDAAEITKDQLFIYLELGGEVDISDEVKKLIHERLPSNFASVTEPAPVEEPSVDPVVALNGLPMIP